MSHDVVALQHRCSLLIIMAFHPVASASSLSALRLVVHDMIDKFDFGSSSNMISPVQGLAQNDAAPNLSILPRYRRLLHAFADYSPAVLQPLVPGYNPIQVAYDFLVVTFIAQYNNFFRVYLELNSFLVTAHSATKISTPTPLVPLPNNNAAPSRNAALKTAVQVRDAYVCRLTGYMHGNFEAAFTAQARALPYQQAAFQQTSRYEMDILQVVHAVPWNPGQVFHGVLRRLVGFYLPAPETAENMVVLATAIHSDFTSFRVYFDSNWHLHFRTSSTAYPRYCHRVLVPRYQNQRLDDLERLGAISLCQDVYDGNRTPLPSLLWFQLHRLIGDVFYASGRAQEIQDEVERAKETGAHILSQENTVLLNLGLQALENAWKNKEDEDEDDK
ncbi:hypothetical protein B0H11DRAFT_1966029 [Mycena galericulata]|nr:hypothetical protein B0H11DRAFT_1966029 [Mycena galericulata]